MLQKSYASMIGYALLAVVSTSVQAAATNGPVDTTAPVKGMTRCAADISLALPVTGRIAEVLETEGALVPAGRVLMHLDRTAEQLDVSRRRTQWQGQGELMAAQARMETAQAQVKAARSIYRDSRGISQEELQNRELAYTTTVSELTRLKTTKQIEELDYLTAKENLDRRTLRSPSRGIITRYFKQKGESVQANDPILKLCDLSRILFVANVPSARSELLKTGDTVELKVGITPVSVRGKLIFVSPVIDAASGLREIKAELINPPKEIRPGAPAALIVNKG
jgi:RND family efflux transporter MFP subunit